MCKHEIAQLDFHFSGCFFCFSKKKKEIKSTKACYYNFYDFTSDPTCLLAETSATLHVLP